MQYRTHNGRVAQPTVVGRFAGLPEARRAIEALQFRIDATHITLMGERAEQAADSTRTHEVDRRTTRRVGRQVVSGSIVGAVVGAVIGAIVAALLVAFSDVPAWPTFVISIAVCAFLVAGFWPYGKVVSKMGLGDAWEQTMADVPDGLVRLGVHANDSQEQEWVVTTLRAHHALDMEEQQP